MTQQVIPKLFLALLSCIVCALAAEVYLRNFYPCPYSDVGFVRPLRFFFQHDEELGWRLRNYALEVIIEPTLCYQDGQPRRSQQIVLRGQGRGDSRAKIRWKLSASDRHSLAETETGLA